MVPILTPAAQPPHCPNPECKHYDFPKKPDWFQKAGTYSTLAFGNVPRFYCNSCGKYFSTQTFSIDYYAKKPVNYRYIYNQINAGAGIRNIARTWRCGTPPSPTESSASPVMPSSFIR
jgi:transposase-like protein